MPAVAEMVGNVVIDPSFMPGLGIRVGTKFKWDGAKLIRKIGEVNARELKFAGAEVRKATRKAMSSRSPRGKPEKWAVGSSKGFRLVANVYRIPKDDIVTSWKTPKHPGGFLRDDIQYDYDFGSKSVVVGPVKIPKVNKLQEFGGSTTLYFSPTPRKGKARYSRTIYGTLSNSPPKAAGGVPEAGIYSFTKQLRPRKFMDIGLKRAMPKIPERWRNKVAGP
jgi:hypothetical protein